MKYKIFMNANMNAHDAMFNMIITFGSLQKEPNHELTVLVRQRADSSMLPKPLDCI